MNLNVKIERTSVEEEKKIYEKHYYQSASSICSQVTESHRTLTKLFLISLFIGSILLNALHLQYNSFIRLCCRSIFVACNNKSTPMIPRQCSKEPKIKFNVRLRVPVSFLMYLDCLYGFFDTIST